MENEIEIWKDVIGWEGLYMISNFGHIKSLDRVIITKDLRKIKFNGCLLKNNKKSDGYFSIGFISSGRRFTTTIHRLVAIHFIPNPENKPEVNHLDGDKSNNAVLNLAWTTKSENTIHAYSMGLMNRRGSKNAFCILNETQVLEIKKLLVDKYEQKDIAVKFGVAPSTISAIKTKRNWALVE